MSLINELTDNIKDLRENIDIVSKKIKENSKQIQAQAKIKFEIASEKRKLDKLYQALGKDFYDFKKEDLPSFDVNQYLKSIDISLAKIESLKLKLQDQTEPRNYSNNLSKNSESFEIDEKDLSINKDNIEDKYDSASKEEEFEESITINEEDLKN